MSSVGLVERLYYSTLTAFKFVKQIVYYPPQYRVPYVSPLKSNDEILFLQQMIKSLTRKDYSWKKLKTVKNQSKKKEMKIKYDWEDEYLNRDKTDTTKFITWGDQNKNSKLWDYLNR